MVPVSDRKVIPHALERRLCIDADAAMSQVVSAVDGGQPLSAQLKSSTSGSSRHTPGRGPRKLLPLHLTSPRLWELAVRLAQHQEDLPGVGGGGQGGQAPGQGRLQPLQGTQPS